MPVEALEVQPDDPLRFVLNYVSEELIRLAEEAGVDLRRLFVCVEVREDEEAIMVSRYRAAEHEADGREEVVMALNIAQGSAAKHGVSDETLVGALMGVPKVTFTTPDELPKRPPRPIGQRPVRRRHGRR